MKLQFNHDLDFQREAIDSITGIFKGQETCRTNFTCSQNSAQQLSAILTGAQPGTRCLDADPAGECCNDRQPCILRHY